jgi:hypothetical protein
LLFLIRLYLFGYALINSILSAFLYLFFMQLPCEPICESLAPSKAPVTEAPTDCYDKYGITEEDIIDKFGSDEPIPEDAINIGYGGNTAVTIGK